MFSALKGLCAFLSPFRTGITGSEVKVKHLLINKNAVYENANVNIN
jgi:hypothetical protein